MRSRTGLYAAFDDRRRPLAQSTRAHIRSFGYDPAAVRASVAVNGHRARMPWWESQGSTPPRVGGLHPPTRAPRQPGKDLFRPPRANGATSHLTSANFSRMIWRRCVRPCSYRPHRPRRCRECWAGRDAISCSTIRGVVAAGNGASSSALPAVRPPRTAWRVCRCCLLSQKTLTGASPPRPWFPGFAAAARGRRPRISSTRSSAKTDNSPSRIRSPDNPQAVDDLLGGAPPPPPPVRQRPRKPWRVHGQGKSCRGAM